MRLTMTRIDHFISKLEYFYGQIIFYIHKYIHTYIHALILFDIKKKCNLNESKVSKFQKYKNKNPNKIKILQIFCKKK